MSSKSLSIITVSQQVARRLGHGVVGPEHLLIAVCEIQKGAGAKILKSLKIPEDQLVQKTEAALPLGANSLRRGEMPFSATSKLVLESAVDLAKRLGHPAVGSDHVLLALKRTAGGGVSRILGLFGLRANVLQREIFKFHG